MTDLTADENRQVLTEFQNRYGAVIQLICEGLDVMPEHSRIGEQMVDYPHPRAHALLSDALRNILESTNPNSPRKLEGAHLLSDDFDSLGTRLYTGGAGFIDWVRSRDPNRSSNMVDNVITGMIRLGRQPTLQGDDEKIYDALVAIHDMFPEWEREGYLERVTQAAANLEEQQKQEVEGAAQRRITKARARITARTGRGGVA